MLISFEIFKKTSLILNTSDTFPVCPKRETVSSQAGDKTRAEHEDGSSSSGGSLSTSPYRG